MKIKEITERSWFPPPKKKKSELISSTDIALRY